MTVDTLQLVKEFHRKFVDEPGIPLDKVRSIRPKLIEEELVELKEAIDLGDQVKILDALLDLQYVLDGTFIAYGLADYKDVGFVIVHVSNMAKLGLDGKPIIRADGKILKPEGWQSPNEELKALLNLTNHVPPSRTVPPNLHIP